MSSYAFCVFLACLAVGSCQFYDALNDWIGANKRSVIPVTHANAPLNIEVYLSLVETFEVDTVNGNAKFSGWLYTSWNDHRLAFETEPRFSGIYNVSVPSNDIWTPNIGLYAGWSENADRCYLTVRSDGRLSCLSGSIFFGTQCDVSKYNEQGTVSCEIKITSWPNEARESHLWFEQGAFWLRNYYKQGRWQLARAKSEMLTEKSACNRCYKSHSYAVYTFTLRDTQK